VWTERYVVYYSRGREYAVRWRAWGEPDDKSHYVKFNNKLEAERLFNALNKQHRAGELPDGPVELFMSQAKWIRYCGVEHDETGSVQYKQVGEQSGPCASGEHDRCTGDLLDICTCPCHLDDIDGMISQYP